MLNTKYFVLALFLFAAMYGCSREPQDLSIPMKGGDYQITVTKVTNGVKDPTKRTKIRCYRESVLDPYKTYHQNKDCKITNVVKTDTRVSFDFDCDKGAFADAKGNMQYSANGDQISWSSTVTNISGNDIDTKTSGVGYYMGKCK
ncbi:MAG: DUF3617 family protein [Thermodesulfobacteriota bacterium]